MDEPERHLGEDILVPQETYQPHEGRWLLTSSHHDSAAVSAPLLEAIKLELAGLWQAYRTDDAPAAACVG